MKLSLKQRLWQAAPWLWMTAGYLYMMWYHIVPGAWIVDSDLAGEMVLADLLNKEGGILTTNWFYTSELRVFHMQWFYRLGLLVFPHDWHAARVFSMALVLALLVAAVLFFTNAAGMGRAGVWCAAALLWPFGFWYLFLCLYGGYYLVYIIFSLLTLGVVLRMGRSSTASRRFLGLVFGSLLGLMSGLNGVRQLMVLYAPLLVAAMAVLAWQLHTGQAATLTAALRESAQSVHMLLSSLLFALCSGAGYLFNTLVLSRSHSYRSYQGLIFDEDPESPLKMLHGYLLLFGYQKEKPLFSFAGISGGLGLLLGIAVLLSLVLLCRRFGRMEREQQFVTAFIVSALFVCAIVFAYLDKGGEQYWLPELPFGVIALMLALHVMPFRLRVSRPALACCFAVCISLCSVATVCSELEDPLRGRPGLDKVVDWLVEQGYTGGYSYFWTSQVVTELSDGQIEMWTIPSEANGMNPWLQRVDHNDRVPEAPYFVLFDPWTDEGPGSFPGGVEVYRDDRYVVQEFTDPYAMKNVLEQRANSE